MVVSATTVGGTTFVRSLAEAPQRPAPAASGSASSSLVPSGEVPCTFHPVSLGPLPAGWVGLVQAAGTSPRDVWLGGYVTDANHENSRGLFLHWDGPSAATWARPRPSPPVVLHYDGTTWRPTDVPTPDGATFVGYDVAADGPDDVRVAADAVFPDYQSTPGVVLHWDGSTWKMATPPSDPDAVLHIQSVDVGAPDDVWVAGSVFDKATGRSSPLVEHFDGNSWTRSRSDDRSLSPRQWCGRSGRSATRYGPSATPG